MTIFTPQLHNLSSIRAKCTNIEAYTSARKSTRHNIFLSPFFLPTLSTQRKGYLTNLPSNGSKLLLVVVILLKVVYSDKLLCF
uniref:Uncharacterized protein n=1 Tax=Rhizophora mucronata TaxID=61149 RepID=A0A2P2KIN7_RHIMU